VIEFLHSRRLVLDPDLATSPMPFVVGLLAVGIGLSLGAGAITDPFHLPRAFDLALICYGIVALIWILNVVHSRLGGWFIVMAYVAVIQLMNVWFGLDSVVALMVVPVVMAVPLIGLGASVITAGVETALLLTFGSGGGAPLALPLALVAIWMMPALMVAAYWPVFRLGDWAWDYFVQTRTALEKARDRQLELNQAMDDLGHANRQLTLVNENLASLRLVAEQAQRTKTMFLSKVSHEFRTPLNMIIGLVDLLLEAPEVYGGPLPSQLREHLEIVNRNCQHLATLVNDVLDLSQVEAGRMSLRRDWFSLAEVIARSVMVVRPLAERKALQLYQEVPDDLSEIYGDGDRIAQVVVNLLSNAARYTEQGSITVRVRQEPGEAIISVADTGEGIADEDKQVIFEPFCQGYSGTRRSGSGGGSGLGLSVSKQFIDLHGGRIWLDSQLGEGSTFYFSLPLEQPVRPVGKPDHWIQRDWQERPRREYREPSRLEQRVVVCDPVEAMAPMLTRFANGVEYVHATDLTELVQEVAHFPAHNVLINHPDPEVMVNMLIEAKDAIRQTPIVGCCVHPLTERATAAGARAYLIKPVTRTRLTEAIVRVETPIRRILVADDNPDDRRFFQMLLHSIEPTWEIELASNGTEALEMMACSQPDLVMLDILMPEKNGWEVMVAKGQDPALRDIPFFVVSAEDPADHAVTSEFVVATIEGGLSLSQLLEGSQRLTNLLRHPSQSDWPSPDPDPE